ncbi:MAG: hypothetical protein RLP14_00620 [Owenweeksia sp.]
MKKHYSIAYRLFIILVFMGLGSQLKAQFFYGLRQEYGKNRVQYNEFDWVFYRFERYDVYFYRGNEELAAQVARLTEKHLVRVENFLDAPLDERVQILVFNNLSDLKQSNVNSSSDEDYNTTGVTRISGRRLFLHFNGDYEELEDHLRSGLSEVVLSNLVYGSFTESIKNSTLLNLPEWYTEGLISYMGDRWNPDVDTRVRDGILSGRYKRINSLMGEDARYAGHSMWYYISQTYGPKVLKNIVYMAIINRNIESGFNYILGKDLDAVTEGWKNFYNNLYKQAKEKDALQGKPFLKAPKGRVVTRMAASDDGRYLAYVCQKFGEYKVYIYDFEKEKRKRILKGGYKIAQNIDYSYPLLAWNPNNTILAMFTEEKGFIYLNFYNLEEKKLEKKQFFKFDKVLSFSYSRDGRKFLLSAVKDGQSDIFIYTILNTKVEQLTNDSYNDLDPAFFDNDKRVAFISNRITDTLKSGEESFDFPKETHDIFAMEAAEPADTSVIWRMTNSDRVNEGRLKEYAPGFLAFTSNRSGTLNRHLIKIDSAISYVDTTTHYDYSFEEYQVTAYNRNILGHVFDPERGKTFDLILRDNRYRIFDTPYQSPEDLNLVAVKPPQPEIPKKIEREGELDQIQMLSETPTPLYYPGVDASDFEINIEDYQFDNPGKPQAPKKEKPEAKKINLLPLPDIATSSGEEEEELEIPPQRNYFLSFYQDNLSVGFDNVFSNPQYQRFTGFVTPDLLNFGFNANIKVGVMDLMHDYSVVGAVRTTFQPLSGTSLAPDAEFYLAVLDYKNRWDKEYVFTRRSQLLVQDFNSYQRIITHEVFPKLIFPFNPVASMRGGIGYRIDKTISLSREPVSLNTDDLYRDYLVARLAYVYDNTRKIGLNLYSGLRYKVFTEYYRDLRTSPTGLHTAGIDARHYTIIHRNLIWANRFASGVSFGPQKLIYILGGVDNSFSSSYEPNTPIAQDNNYIFQTLATNMRGSFQNIRNGDKFAVINSEIRWPILSYFFKRPIRSDFFKNLQIIAFGDVGTAWNGLTPYSEENVINSTTIPFGNGSIVLDSQKEPIVGGIGGGLRTRLFGYFLRFDWAWGIEDGLVKPNIFYFSLGTDF